MGPCMKRPSIVFKQCCLNVACAHFIVSRLSTDLSILIINSNTINYTVLYLKACKKNTHIIHKHYDEIWVLRGNCTMHNCAQQNNLQYPSHPGLLPFLPHQRPTFLQTCWPASSLCRPMLDHVTLTPITWLYLSSRASFPFPLLARRRLNWSGNGVADNRRSVARHNLIF